MKSSFNNLANEIVFGIKDKNEIYKIPFVHGPGGTGKSTLINYICEKVDTVCVNAPTGIAALNVGGKTLHSRFGLLRGFNSLNVEHIYARLLEKGEDFADIECLIIDEISMVNSDIFNTLNLLFQRLRGNRELFGGLKVVLFGDLYQLAPVMIKNDSISQSIINSFGTEWFWGSLDTNDLGKIKLYELEEVFRQDDPEFINNLNQIRKGHNVLEVIDYFNTSCDLKSITSTNGDGVVVVTGTNNEANRHNINMLNNLNTKQHSYRATEDDGFPESQKFAANTIHLKAGARIMFTTNDFENQWCNGSMGDVIECSEDSILVEMDNGQRIDVSRYSHIIEDMVDGNYITYVFSQFPVRLAWALTVHKCQGLTLDRIHIVRGRGFWGYGQLYVALSRCTSISGISFETDLQPSDVKVCPDVRWFFKRQRAAYNNSGFYKKYHVGSTTLFNYLPISSTTVSGQVNK